MPLPAVTAIDTTIFFSDGKNPEAGFGSGIVISPNYVLSAAHNFYPEDEARKGNGRNQDEIRVSNSKNQLRLNSRRIGHPKDIGDLDVNVRAGRNGDIFYPTNWKSTLSIEDDIAFVKTVNNSLISSSPSVGLIAFINPKTSKGYTIQTAGYPLDNVSSNIPGNSGQETRDLVLAPGSFDQLGAIHSAVGRRIEYTDNIDTEAGQSGSPIWHTLEGDEPRVLGVHSRRAARRNAGTLIDKDIYDKIINQIKGDGNANELPENAIIGTDSSFDSSFFSLDFPPILSSGNDTILGTYRKERILGNGGNDQLYGGGADDRLEGGKGTDQALFSDPFTDSNNKFNYDLRITNVGNIENPEFEFDHTGGSLVDGKDTTKNIEFAVFGFDKTKENNNPEDLFYVPLQVDPNKPTKLKDGALITPSTKIFSDKKNKLGTLTVESPA